MVSVHLPSDVLLQHLPSYLSFSYPGRGVSLHGCSSKAQLLLLPLDEGYLLTAAIPDLQRGSSRPSSRPTAPPDAPPGLRPWPQARGGSSGSPSLASGMRCLPPAAALGLRLGVAPQGHRPWPRVQGGFSRPPLTSDEMAVWGGPTNSCKKKRGKKQRRKGKI